MLWIMYLSRLSNAEQAAAALEKDVAAKSASGSQSVFHAAHSVQSVRNGFTVRVSKARKVHHRAGTGRRLSHSVCVFVSAFGDKKNR